MKGAGRYQPARGDVVWLSLDPRTGHEQAGRRPAVVLSPASYNKKVGLALFCAVTGRVKGYPFEVAIPAGLHVKGVALADQVKCLDWRVRRAELVCRLPQDVTAEILEKLRVLLDPAEG